LNNALPDLGTELEALLREAGESRLAGEVASLRIVEPCGCGDDFCSSFYTAPRPEGTWGPGHQTIPLAPDLIVDVVGGHVVYIEVLCRGEIRAKLRSLFS
jgi:hypothetical protein